MDLPPTKRLSAEPLHERHLAELCRMHGDARVMATLGGVRSDGETERFLRANLDHWRRHGHGLLVFRERASGAFVGRGGLRHVEVAGSAEVELAYAVMAAFWGRGLGGEMAAALLRHGGERLGLRGIVAFTLTTNAASRRVMEKLGFRFERNIVHAGLPHVLYRRGPVPTCPSPSGRPTARLRDG
jgi:[ribosomal protein S5]-alanine N-acetyltransferase